LQRMQRPRVSGFAKEERKRRQTHDHEAAHDDPTRRRATATKATSGLGAHQAFTTKS
jgi:hypothetical protein